MADAITNDIKQSVQALAASGDQAALQKYLATSPYSADQLASATGYKATDLQAAITSAKSALPSAETWTPAANTQQQGGVTQMRGGDPGVSSGYNPQTQYEAAKLVGFRGTYEDWAQQQATNKQQALQELAANPNVVVGPHTPASQIEAVQNAQLPPATLPGTGAGGATGSGTGGAGTSGGLSTAQQALLKALMDQQEMDGITGEMRQNASELYDRTQNYEADQLNDIATFTGGNSGIYGRYQPDIDNDVGTAVADARAGQTAALNTAARQAMRYGIQVPSTLGAVSSSQASQLASAANTTRNNAIDKYRGLVGQGIGLKDGTFKTSQAGTADAMGRAEAASMAGRNMRIQNESLDWAKQLDVTGMARGMPGASQGAYGVAVGAGNSAVQNQMAPGQALIGAMGQSNNTVMQGQNLAMQGTLGVLNSQTQMAGKDDGMMGAIGTIGGAAITAF